MRAPPSDRSWFLPFGYRLFDSTAMLHTMDYPTQDGFSNRTHGKLYLLQEFQQESRHHGLHHFALHLFTSDASRGSGQWWKTMAITPWRSMVLPRAQCRSRTRPRKDGTLREHRFDTWFPRKIDAAHCNSLAPNPARKSRAFSSSSSVSSSFDASRSRKGGKSLLTDPRYGWNKLMFIIIDQ